MDESLLKQRRSTCPINHIIEIMGDKWTMLVVRDMIFHAKRSYSELQAMPEGIATNILSERLARLERWGLLTKGRDPQDGRRSIYALTEAGMQLIPLLVEMMIWSHGHTDAVDMTTGLAATMAADREGATRELRARLERAHGTSQT
ncbi:MAG: helix-turn-helix domain-containing protein [Myxococcota bacterium]